MKNKCPKQYRKTWQNTYKDRVMLIALGALCAIGFWCMFLLS